MDGPALFKGVMIMSGQWARREMASVDLGDVRLNERTAEVLAALGEQPTLSIPAACRGRAETAGAYRLLDNPKASFQKVLAPHQSCTQERLAEHPFVVFVQDTTEVDLTGRNVRGAGMLDRHRQGVLLHVLHAFTPAGTPLGSVWASCLVRPELIQADKNQKRKKQKKAPIEQKESYRWIEGFGQSRESVLRANIRGVCVSDSESDVYELLAEALARPGPCALIVRACHDRGVVGVGDQSISQQVLCGKVLYEATIQLRRREAKVAPAIEKRGRRVSRGPREARVQVRAASVRLLPPPRPDRTLPALDANVVLVSEIDAPAGEEPVQWMLLTGLPIDTAQQVRQIVQYYCLRWNIEILFRTLKSGCRVEQRRLEDLSRTLPMLAMYLIVAWRTMWVCREAREHPEAPCRNVFEASEWQALWLTVKRMALPEQEPPLGQITQLLAQLGGYLPRTTSPPGPQVIWIGLQRLHDLAQAWEAFGPEARKRRKRCV
jgi:hypothetical protein